MTDRIRRLRPGQALKDQLPYPYNQDLSGVLRGLRRRTPLGRRRLANDPVTAAYLAAAARLIQQHLGPGTSREPPDPDDPDLISRPLLSFLSQRAVAAEVANNPPPFHQVGRVATLRDRWPHQAAFVADVLRFGLWIWHYPADHHDEAATALAEVAGGADPVGGLQQIGYWVLARLLRTPMFRLGLVAAAQAEGDPVIGAAMAGRYQENSARWQEHYAAFLRSRRLRLRPGVSLADCDVLLTAIAEGLALRALADPGAGVLDHARQRSLLGTAELIIVAAAVERDGPVPGQSLEESVRAILGRPAPAADRKKA